MKLLPDWAAILKRAWSVRFIAIAFVLTVIEVTLSALQGLMIIPQFMPAGVFAALAGLFSAAAFVARIIAQKSLGAD